jgi:hypothetical protein
MTRPPSSDYESIMLHDTSENVQPGRQPENRIAGTAAEQLARALRPRLTPRQRRSRRLRRLIGRIVREVLARELPEALTVLLLDRGGRR